MTSGEKFVRMSSDHNDDARDIESQQTPLLIAGDSKRDHWRWIIPILLARRNLISRADKAKTKTDCERQRDADLEQTEIVEILPSSPQVLIDIHCDGTNDSTDVSDVKLQHANIAQIVKAKDFGSLQRFGGIPGIAEALDTDLQKGIPGDEEDLRSRCIINTLLKAEAPARSFFKSLLKSGNSYIILLLCVSAAMSIAFGINEKGMRTGWHQGVIIILSIIILVVVSLGRHFLHKHSEKHNPLRKMQMEVDVLRGGNSQKISISDVVNGDIVLLRRGYYVPGDGLFISGECLELDDSLSTTDEQNPFLYYGAKVINGHGWMLVTSVGMNTALGEMMSQVTQAPSKIKLLYQINKVSIITQIIGLLVSILILVVVFLRFRHGKKHPDSGSPELGNSSMKDLTDIMKRIIMKPIGNVSILITSLAMLIVRIMEVVPLVVTLAILYWHKKALSDRAFAQEPLACVSMGSVTTICTGNTGGLTRQATKAFIDADVNIILISEEDVSVLEAIKLECGLLHIPESLVVEGEVFRRWTDEERMLMVDNISVIGNSLPSDKLLLVQCLKQKGHTVAMVGARANDTPALKEANLGITIGSWSSELARETSDIVVWDGDFNSLLIICKYGRCVYNNIQKYIQFEVTMFLVWALDTVITTVAFGDAPITAIQWFWTNLIVAFAGGLGLLTEPPRKELMEKPPVKQTDPFITKAIWRNIITQALFQAAILVTFQFTSKSILHINNKEVRETMVFNSFVLCQVFNLINARKPNRKNMFKGIHQNRWFWVAVIVIVVQQVAFIEIAHILVRSAKLNGGQWGICVLTGMLSLLIDFAAKCISTLFMYCLTGSHLGSAGMTFSESASNLELPLFHTSVQIPQQNHIPFH
ncbi:hypothetical protein ACOSQ3_016007 [Xanthoceras sorbifolium]